MRSLTILTICLVACFVKSEPPKSFNPCKNDESFNTCVKDVMQILLPKLAINGLSEFEIIPLENIVEPEIKFEYRKNQIAAKILIKNFKVDGIKDVIVKDVRSNIKNKFKIEVDLEIPTAIFHGSFKAEGKFNVIVVNAKGIFNVTLGDMSTTLKISGAPEVKNDKTYMKIKNIKMIPKFKSINIYISDVFPGDPKLSSDAREILNNNWQLIYKELVPVAKKYWDPAMTSIANKIFQKIPIDQLILNV